MWATQEASKDREIVKKIRILIVDDHQLLREGLKTLLSMDEELEVVGAAESGEEAIAKIGEYEPDVIFMDMRMDGMSGVEAVRIIKEKHPTVSAIMLTAYKDEGSIADAVQAGAAGYLLKDASAELICHAAHTVYEGGSLLGGGLLQEALTLLRTPHRSDGESPGQGGRVSNLTHRESQVLRLIVDGMANKEIAATLVIAEDTVKKHVQSIIAKLGVSDRTQAAVKAVRQALVD
jgi:DNA-binding NarL/FixJ family response regulator